MKMHFFPTSSSQTLLNSVQPFGDWGLQVKNPCIRRKEPGSLKDCVGPPTWPAWIVTSEINKPLWCYATEVWKSAVPTVSLLLPINIVAVTPSPKWWDWWSFVYRSSRISAIKPMWGPPVQPLFYRAVIYTFRRWLIQVLPMGLVSWSCHRPPTPPPEDFLYISQRERHLETSRTEEYFWVLGNGHFQHGVWKEHHSSRGLQVSSRGLVTAGAGQHAVSPRLCLAGWHSRPHKSAVPASGPACPQQLGDAGCRPLWATQELELEKKRVKEPGKQTHT